MASEDTNVITVIGNLTKDPEITTYGQEGKQRGTIRIACNRRPAKGGGQQQTDFFDVKVWDQQAKVVGEFLSKGKRVAVVGRLQIDEVDAREGGGKKYFTSINAQSVQFLSPKDGDSQGGGDAGGGSQPADDLPW